MKHRAVTVLSGAAPLMLPVIAVAQSELPSFKRIFDGIDALWNETGERAQILEEQPSDPDPSWSRIPPCQARAASP